MGNIQYYVLCPRYDLKAASVDKSPRFVNGIAAMYASKMNPW